MGPRPGIGCRGLIGTPLEGRRAIPVLNMFNARFTLADLMPRLCPDAVGGESGSTHQMHARPDPCRAGTPFTLADAPAHRRLIWIRSRVHYDSLSCTQLKNIIILTRVVYALYNTYGSSLSPIHSFLLCFFFVLLQVLQDVGAAGG